MEKIFQHGVASGDPLQDRVMLWTRLTLAKKEDLQLSWAIATDPDFADVVNSGTALACAEDDHTVRVDATGLRPGRRYFYRFHALGEISPIGRTKTLPPNEGSHLRFAQVSCAQYNAGFFNAYARIAERDDLDFVLHLGDYIYESANVPPAGQTPGADIGRPFEPLHECKTLADYRKRYNQYHRDPDVQRLRACLPILATMGEHELAVGAWRGGADTHEEAGSGAWAERVKAALRVRREWMPIRLPDPADPQRSYRSIRAGKLADLFLINTHLYRDEPAPSPRMHDPDRSALGLQQRKWLLTEFDRSDATWRIIGSPTVMGNTWKKDLPDAARLPLVKTRLIAADGLGPEREQWDGYPAERYLLLRRMRDHILGNFVVLSGQAGIGLAQELRIDPSDPGSKPIAIECVSNSVTAQNLDDKMKWQPRTQSVEYEKELLRAFPEMQHIDLDDHGYSIVDVTPERVVVEWWSVETVLKPTDKERRSAAFKIESHRPLLVAVP